MYGKYDGGLAASSILLLDVLQDLTVGIGQAYIMKKAGWTSGVCVDIKKIQKKCHMDRMEWKSVPGGMEIRSQH